MQHKSNGESRDEVSQGPAGTGDMIGIAQGIIRAMGSAAAQETRGTQHPETRTRAVSSHGLDALQHSLANRSLSEYRDRAHGVGARPYGVHAFLNALTT